MSDPHASAAAAVDDEPRTPGWLPALGAALFITVGLWWAVTPAPPPPVVAAAPSTSASAAPPPAPTPTPPPSPAPAQAAAANTVRQPVAIPSNLPPNLQQQIQNIRNRPRP